MKIAFFTDTTYPQPGGVASHIKETSEELVKRGHHIGIFAPKLRGQKQTKDIEFFHLPSFPLFSWIFKWETRIVIPYHPKITRAVKKFNPEIIHVQTPYAAGIAGRHVAHKLDIPLVETFHGYIMDPGYLKVFKLGWAASFLDGLIWNHLINGLNQADLVISPTKRGKRDLVAHKVKREVRVIPNGVNLRLIKEGLKQADIESLEKNLSLTEETILYVGRLSWEKNLDILVRAFSQVAKEITSSRLLLIGDGPARKQLENLSKELDLEKQIIFAGFIPRKEILEKGYLGTGSVFATTSKSENQPVSIIEAMAACLPIVAVKSLGLTELVGSYGILCEPDNPSAVARELIKILRDKSPRESLQEKSRKRAEDFSIEKTTEQLLQSYTRIIRNV